jgi:hypothetical protein
MLIPNFLLQLPAFGAMDKIRSERKDEDSLIDREDTNQSLRYVDQFF